jgi:1,4-alpha-glucan branching enzyme
LRVFLAGDFNDWDPERHSMHKNPNGVWECQVPLPPGRYGYHFVVDGMPRPDPHCRVQERTVAGAPRCIVDVAAPGGRSDPA